ncbi:TIGR04219 family outer membrane beta-barrel protein [Photobacterium kishitanii]|uniref:TIGR04219 family outer membrane beta-barrel protein n=1 Tax=Photobacterium kishitanii TaxID=318456 RepID=A0A2T3KLD0_9GAMM|nr:TIGR04219 family outer membrane beta-barrel protein [Photobacterium kishitanii]PSV00528.1 hypothetical protein C9J27_05180 [Photobacterium kishitanii]
MKNKTILAAIIAALVPMTSFADELGGSVDLGMWNSTQQSAGGSDSHKEVFIAEGQFEHFIPLIPNVRFDTLSISNNDVKVSQTALTGYYQIFDNSLLNVDVGAGLTVAYDGSFANLKDARKTVSNFKGNTAKVNDVMPHIYAGVRVAVPFIEDLSVFGNGYKYTNGRSNGYDVKAGVQYDVGLAHVAKLRLKAGYRQIEGNFLNDMQSLNSKGAFVSVGIQV